MGAERSTDKTRTTAATAVPFHVIKCGDLAPLYAHALVVRGYEVKGYSSEDGEIKCSARAVDSVETTAPDSVFAEMDAGYKARNKKPEKPAK